MVLMPLEKRSMVFFCLFFRLRHRNVGYASLYKAYGETVDCIKADDITVSVIREAKPEKLFRYFGEHGYTITSADKGIYYVKDKVLFPTQIIVMKELEGNSHKWLKALSGRLQKEDIRELLDDRMRMNEKADKEFADSVLKVSIGANKQVIEELIGDDDMCNALMEIMEPQLLLREKEVRKEGIQGAVDMLREFGHRDLEIKNAIMQRYGLSLEEAEEYL